MKNSKELTALVKAEAKNLKEFATKEELNNLNFKELNPEHYRHCIYGQLTGSCLSDRATELIKKCCYKVYEMTDDVKMEQKLNGKPSEKRASIYNLMWLSPIEVFIVQPENIESKANKKLIDYLKGESKTLDI